MVFEKLFSGVLRFFRPRRSPSAQVVHESAQGEWVEWDTDASRFVYIKIPQPIGPLDRANSYEDPLAEVLAQHSLGEITGGGSQLSDPAADGSRYVEFCGIDLDTPDLQGLLPVLREALVGLAAPVGTEIHFSKDGVPLQDELRSEGWLLDQPRTWRHPAFGC